MSWEGNTVDTPSDIVVWRPPNYGEERLKVAKDLENM